MREMTGFQKLIKYCAIAFAVFLIFNIFSSVLGALAMFDFVSSRLTYEKGEFEEIKIGNNFKNLKIDVSGTNLEILNGDKFSLKTDNKNIFVEEKNGSCVIKENVHNFLKTVGKSTVVLTIPENYVFENLTVETLAGNFKADMLNAKKLTFDIGVGETEIDKLFSESKTEIDTGVGDFTIIDATVNNLEFDTGVGDVNLKAEIKGESELNCGIGSLNLTLKGDESDYKINVEKGLGKVEVDGKSAKDDLSTYGSGENEIEIECGIGEVNLNYSA